MFFRYRNRPICYCNAFIVKFQSSLSTKQYFLTVDERETITITSILKKMPRVSSKNTSYNLYQQKNNTKAHYCYVPSP